MLVIAGVTGFYNVDLGTGAATLIGTNVIQIVDIAQAQIGPAQRVPEQTSVLLLGLANHTQERPRLPFIEEKDSYAFTEHR